MKKKFVIFSVLVAMLFAVGIVSASAATSSGNTNRLVSAGLPCDMLFSLPSGNFANISSANVWIANSDGPASTTVSTQDGWRPTILFNRDDSAQAAADVLVSGYGDAILRRITSTFPFNPWNMTTDERTRMGVDIGLGVLGPVDAVYTQSVTRTYNVRIPYQNQNGQFVWGTVGRTFNNTYTVNAVANTVSYIEVPLFTDTQLQAILEGLAAEGYDIEQAIISSIDVYINDFNPSRINTVYLSNQIRQDDLYATIRQIASNSLGDLYEVSISYDNLDWTSWLTNAVGGFMSFELVPGLPIYGILSALLGIPLLIWFLRLFAGG